MNDFDADSTPEGDWEEPRELGWSEFDWEEYLRLQDQAVARYLKLYASLEDNPERIDEAARQMGWDRTDWNVEIEDESALFNREASEDEEEALDPCSVHRNPVFIASKAIFLSLRHAWIGVAAVVPHPTGPLFENTLHRGEDQIGQAIQSLDLGDYALAISLFKRALRELNSAQSYVGDPELVETHRWRAFVSLARRHLFDLREVCLRVMQECRNELARPFDDEA